MLFNQCLNPQGLHDLRVSLASQYDSLLGKFGCSQYSRARTIFTFHTLFAILPIIPSPLTVDTFMCAPLVIGHGFTASSRGAEGCPLGAKGARKNRWHAGRILRESVFTDSLVLASTFYIPASDLSQWT